MTKSAIKSRKTWASVVFSFVACGVVNVYGIDIGGQKNNSEVMQKPTQIRIPALLPRVEYYGGAEFGGVPDLRLGIFLYEQVQLFFHRQNSALLPLNFSEADRDSLEGGSAGQRNLVENNPIKKFTFDDGTIIYYSESNKTILLFSEEQDGIFFVMKSDDQVFI